MRERCYQCFRPKTHCFCKAIPRIDNRTNVLILQHIGERFHPFNTARIVRKSLRDCQLVADHNQRLGMHRLPIQPGAGLLYPGSNARALSELTPAERPSQLVIVDGTWHQAKTIVRDVPQLRDLPCYLLTPSSPGQYRIRREPDAQSLSTLEATVAALRVLEPETVGLDQLQSVFNEMVENQLGHLASHARFQRKRTRHGRPLHIPRAIFQNPEGLVVAYGEATPDRGRQRTAPPLPVNWVAKRLGTAERFACCLHQEQPLLETGLRHMRLTTEDFAAAISQEEFRQRWNRFLRPNDVLVVYHSKTSQLLSHVEASRPRCLVLKSIFGKWKSGFRSLEELVVVEGIEVPRSKGKNRANRRLDMAVALVEHLRDREQKNLRETDPLVF